MKERNHSSFGVILASCVALCGEGCASPPELTSGTDALEAPLFARTQVLWPVVNGVASVSVCWAQSRFETTYPVPSLRPDLAALLPERKQWIREIVEEQWNGRTALQFTGWHECSAAAATDVAADVDVELTPIDTGVTASCANGSLGQPCVDALGRDLAGGGGGVFLNVFFGEEVLYSSRYQQGNPGAQYDASNEPNSNLAYPYFLPQACFDDFQYAWATNNSLTPHAVDVNDPSVLAEFMAIYENCLKFNALHEFGHIAGFAHEQQRSDTSAGCTAETNPDFEYVGDAPLGPFDVQSIMSYCRTNNAATLTDRDVEFANLVYRGDIPDAGASGEAAEPGNDAGAAPRPPVVPPSGVGGSTASMGGASNGGGSTVAPSGSGASAAGASTPDAPIGSTPEARRRDGGCSVASSSKPNEHWWALAVGAMLVAARARRAARPAARPRRHESAPQS